MQKKINTGINPIIQDTISNIDTLNNEYNFYMSAIKKDVDENIDSNMNTSKKDVDENIDSNMNTSKKLKEIISKIEEEFSKIVDFENYIK